MKTELTKQKNTTGKKFNREKTEYSDAQGQQEKKWNWNEMRKKKPQPYGNHHQFFLRGMDKFKSIKLSTGREMERMK